MALKIDDLESVEHGGPEGAWHARDGAAFQAAYDRYHDRIYRFCRYRLGDPYEAEDVAQETFVRAWKSRTVLFEEQRLYPWLRVVAANLCTDLLRRRNRCQPTPEVELGAVDRTEEQVVGAGDVQMLRQAMARLTDRHRTALVQRETAGWTYEQMAAHAGTTIASIESLLWRARQALKREFTAIAGPDGVLAGLPVIGLVIRKLHQARARVAGWMSRGFAPEMAGGNAMVASLLGSATAVCVATVGALLGPAAAAAVGGVPAGARNVPPAAATAAASGTARGASASGARPGSTGDHLLQGVVAAQGVNRPVDVIHSPQRVQAMPLQVSGSGLGAPDSLGVSPGNATGYAWAVVQHRIIDPLGVTKP